MIPAPQIHTNALPGLSLTGALRLPATPAGLHHPLRTTPSYTAGLRLTLVALAAALPAAGCATAIPRDPFAGRAGDAEVVLIVENHSTEVMQIALVLQGVLRPLGRVDGLARRQFRIGRQIAGARDDVHIHAGPPHDTSVSWTSPHLLLGGGEQVNVIVRRNVPLSTYQVTTLSRR